MVMKI